MNACGRRLAVTIAISFILFCGNGVGAQQAPPSSEISLGRCDRLPIIAVQVDTVEMHFLVDTAATSMLNLKSFSTGRSRHVQVSSWNGTKAANGREVLLPEMRLGK